MICLPVMRPLEEREVEQQKETEIEIGPALLRAMYANPAGKQENWAATVGCSKSTINRTLQKLKGERLVKSITGKWRLTVAGEKEAFNDGASAFHSAEQA
jgi:DNA-binding IclR family transcriptional regulator